MNILQYTLGKLAEESNEVGQMALKCQQFGLDDIFDDPSNPDMLTNRQRLFSELHDLIAMLHLLNDDFDLGYALDMNVVSYKNDYKFPKWLEYVANKGIIPKEEVNEFKRRREQER